MSSDSLEADELPRPGDVVADKYEIEGILGSGAMGVVFSARHIDLGQRYAIKFLHPQVAQDTGAITRFLREARAAAGIQSEHVVRVHDVARTEKGTPYLVMEYLTGTDLQRLTRARGMLPIAEVIGYILQACEALAEAHVAGIVHRDLKPGNLFLTHRADGSPLVKVLDFGISKVAPGGIPGMPLDESLTADGQILGSPFYMSPEQLRSSKGVDARTDIWALGSMIYKLLTGRHAFPSDSAAVYIASITTEPPTPLRPFRPDVPAELERVILRCLERDMSRRFQNVGEFARGLQPFATARAQISIERILGVMVSLEAVTEKNAMRGDPQSSRQGGGPAARQPPPAEQERAARPKLASPEAPAIVSPGFAQVPTRQPDRMTASSFNPAMVSSQPNAQPPPHGVKSGTVRMPAVSGLGPTPQGPPPAPPPPGWYPPQQQGGPYGGTPTWSPSQPGAQPQGAAQTWNPQQGATGTPQAQASAASWQQARQSVTGMQPPQPSTSSWRPPAPPQPAAATTTGRASHPDLAAAASAGLGPAPYGVSTNPPPPKRPRVVILVGGVLLAAAIAAAAWWLLHKKPQPAPLSPEEPTATAALPSAAPPPTATAAASAEPTAEGSAAGLPSAAPAASAAASAPPAASAAASAPPAASAAASAPVLKPWPSATLTGSVPRPPPPVSSAWKLPPKVKEEPKVDKVEEKAEEPPKTPKPDMPVDPFL